MGNVWPKQLLRSFAVVVTVQATMPAPLPTASAVTFEDYDETYYLDVLETAEDVHCHDSIISEKTMIPEIEGEKSDQEISLYSQEAHQADINENIETTLGETMTGQWGTVPWEYNLDNRTIILHGGDAGNMPDAPWKHHREVERINVAEKVILQENSQMLFVALQELVAIDNSNNLDFSNVTRMESMFFGATKLRELDVTSWDVSNVNNMHYAFAGTWSLSTLNVSEWDTSSLEVAAHMFIESGITKLDLSNWQLNQINVYAMFTRADNLKTLILGENSILSERMNLPMIQHENYTGRWIRRRDNLVLDYSNVFENSDAFVRNYTGEAPGNYTWEPVLSLWGTVPWEYDEDTESIILYGGIAGSVTEAPWRTYNSVKQIIIEKSVSLQENSSNLFSGLNNLETIVHAKNLDVSNVRDMSAMFNQAQSLKELDVSNWDTSQVTNMTTMFQDARSLTTLDVSQWNTSQVRNMSTMFNQAQSLKELDVSNWDTSQVTNMTTMFQDTRSLTTLDVSNWDTSQVYVGNMSNMFAHTNALNRITLGERSIFSAAVFLPAIPSNEQYTGRWILEENLSGDGSAVAFENSTEFMANYDGSFPGTYAWERVTPEQLFANIDRVSDQSQTITGYATELVDEFTITYQNTEGNTVILTKDDPRIIWGDYQESNQQVRQFQIDLIGNERLETETKVTITVSKPSVETTGDRTEEQTVIKGIDYRANNLTLDRFKINELSTQEELETLILQESRAQAANVLTEADMTDDFRIVETDLTREVDEDGSYFAVLEVGNKAYQQVIGIDVTSKLEHMRVTIPTKMVFESLYNTAESNRNFESQAYEIRNQSPLAVDTYINQLAIDDPAGIVLLEEGEDPLDYAESEEEDPTLSYDDISTPLLRLNLKTDETQIQLYKAMEEQHLVRLEERSRVPISLTGDFYGDYPQWVIDAEADQGGYYEDLLVPNYRIVLRFVPRD